MPGLPATLYTLFYGLAKSLFFTTFEVAGFKESNAPIMCDQCGNTCTDNKTCTSDHPVIVKIGYCDSCDVAIIKTVSRISV
jgi:hypothetical protein